jgi:hypothetical protein
MFTAHPQFGGLPGREFSSLTSATRARSANSQPVGKSAGGFLHPYDGRLPFFRLGVFLSLRLSFAGNTPRILRRQKGRVPDHASPERRHGRPPKSRGRCVRPTGRMGAGATDICPERFLFRAAIFPRFRRTLRRPPLRLKCSVVPRAAEEEPAPDGKKANRSRHAPNRMRNATPNTCCCVAEIQPNETNGTYETP